MFGYVEFEQCLMITLKPYLTAGSIDGKGSMAANKCGFTTILIEIIGPATNLYKEIR